MHLSKNGWKAACIVIAILSCLSIEWSKSIDAKKYADLSESYDAEKYIADMMADVIADKNQQIDDLNQQIVELKAQLPK